MRLLQGMIFTALLLAWEGSSASFIEMATEFSIVDTADGLELAVTSENKGDEPSHAVQFEVKVGTRLFTTSPVTRLAVAERISDQFLVDDAFDSPGRYPIVIRTHYKDANAYAFSALAVGFYDHLQPTISKIQLRVEDAILPANGSAELPVTITNGDSEPRDLQLELHLPNELASPSMRQRLSVAPGAEVVVDYDIENFSALENSTYAVAVVAEYQNGDIHYSAYGPAVVQITKARMISEAQLWGLAAAGLIVFVLTVTVLRNRRTEA